MKKQTRLPHNTGAIKRNARYARMAYHALRAFHDIRDDEDAKLDASSELWEDKLVEDCIMHLLKCLIHLTFRRGASFAELDQLASDLATQEMIEAGFQI